MADNRVHINASKGRRDSAVDIVPYHGMDVRGIVARFAAEGNTLFSSSERPVRPSNHAASYSKTLFPAVKQRWHKYNHSLPKLRLKLSVFHTSISCHGAMLKHTNLPTSTYEIFSQTLSPYCEVILCNLCKVNIKESHFQ
jgi:hypothetical protein